VYSFVKGIQYSSMCHSISRHGYQVHMLVALTNQDSTTVVLKLALPSFFSH
jgi:hypothetical protein